MRIFCPYCSTEHAIDVNQIPLVGMGFHCPQCSRSFHVTADGEVEATDESGEGDPLSGEVGGGPADDPLAPFSGDLLLEDDLGVPGATEEELLAANLEPAPAAPASPPPLPPPDGDGEEGDDEGATRAIAQVDLFGDADTAAPRPPRVSPPDEEATLADPFGGDRLGADPFADVDPFDAIDPFAVPPHKPGSAPVEEPPAPKREEAPAPATAGVEAGLSPDDLVLIGAYQKTTDALTQPEDVVWIPGQAPPGTAGRRSPRKETSPSPPPPPRTTPVGDSFGNSLVEEPPPRSATGPLASTPPREAPPGPGAPVGEADVDLESPFEITQMAPPAASASGSEKARAASIDAAENDDWQMPDFEFGVDPFAAAADEEEQPAQAPDGPDWLSGSDPLGGADAGDPFGAVDVGDPFGAADVGDPFGAADVGPPGASEDDPTGALFGVGPDEGMADAGAASGAVTGPTTDVTDPDALFDLDFEIGGVTQNVSPSGPDLAPPPGFGAPADAGAPSPAGEDDNPTTSLSAGGPLLEEMDFSTLLQEEGDEGGGSLFDIEPESAFDDAGEVADAPAEPSAPEPPARAPGDAYDPNALFDLDFHGDGPASPGVGDGAGASAAVSTAGARASEFKPAKVPSRRRRRAMGRGPKFGLAAALVVVLVGVLLGQIEDVGYFGVKLLFPPQKQTKMYRPPPTPVATVTDNHAAFEGDRVSDYLQEIERLDKEIELHPNNREIPLALVGALLRFNTRFPDEFAHNTKLQNRLAELSKEPEMVPNGPALARMKLLAGQPEEAKATLDSFGRRPSDSLEVRVDYELLYGQIEMKLEDYESALGHFDEVLKIDASNIAAGYLRGKCLRLLHRLAEARDAFQTVLQKSPKHDSARLGLAEILLELDDVHKALELAEAIRQEAQEHSLVEQAFAANRLLAEAYGKLGDAEKQQEHLEIALQIKPDDEPLLLRMAVTLQSQGKIEEAKTRLEGCPKEACQSAEYFRTLAEIYGQIKDDEGTLQALTRGLKAHPSDVALLLLQGKALMARNEGVAAKDSFERALEVDPTNATAYVLLTDLLVAGARFDEAGTTLHKGIKSVAHPEVLMERLADLLLSRGQVSEAKKLLGDLIERDPLRFKARLKLAVLLRQSGLVAEALTHFEFLYRNNQMQREVRMAYAEALIAARRFEQADAELRKVLRIEPGALDAKVLLSAALVERERYDEAETLLMDVTEKDPRNGPACYYMGRLELARDRPHKALDYLSQAIRATEVLPVYRFEYADTLVRLGGRNNLRKAEAAYTGIISAQKTGTHKGPPFDRMTDVYLNRGKVRLQLRLYDRALEDFQRAMDRDSNRADTVTGFASGLVKKKRFGEARRFLESVIRENPHYPPAHYWLGIVFSNLRDSSKAKRHFVKALMEDDTAFPDAHRYLGYLYREERLDRLARKSFVRYLELVGDAAPFREEIERLIGKRR